MTSWRPATGPATSGRRAALLERARAYFAEQDVLAVDTPTLSQYAATDPNIDSLTVRAGSGMHFFLHTSPEFFMKRLLADGYPDCYSICRVFRDGEAGQRHSPEFTMVEWYRLGFNLNGMIDDSVRFVAACLDEPSLTENVVQYEYAEAFQQFAEIDVFEATISELCRVCQGDERLKSEIGADRNAWLDLIMSTIVAPALSAEKLTVIQHYPANQAALARLCPDDSRVADRFEVFFGALELANGYVELTHAVEQRRRMDRDLDKRQATGRRQYPCDELLISALDSGLPDCGGVAVGVERLQMVLDKTDDIRDVVTFVSEIS